MLVLLAGCDQVFLGERPPAVTVDAPEEGPFCYGHHGANGAGLLLQQICLPTPPPETWESSTLITTGMMSSDCTYDIAQDGKDLCVIAARDITISAGIKATGGRPLVFLARRNLVIEDGVALNLVSGPASDDKDCPQAIGTMGMTGGGGGAGGGYGTTGAKGGNGAGGIGGASPGISGPPITLRGGCGGSKGGEGTGTTSAGGHSGGAVYFIGG